MAWHGLSGIDAVPTSATTATAIEIQVTSANRAELSSFRTLLLFSRLSSLVWLLHSRRKATLHSPLATTPALLQRMAR